MWGESVNGLRLSAVAEHEMFRPGRPVIIHLWLQNTGSTKPIVLAATQPLADYEFRVTGPDGAAAALTPAGRDAVKFIESGERFRRIRIALEPGQTREEVVALSEWLDLSRAGRYSVTVARRDWADEQGRHPTAAPVSFSIG